MKEILKYRDHSNIVIIRNQCKNRNSFNFTKAERKELKHLILNQDANKVSQSSDIPLKILKENIDIFSDFP